MALVRPVQARDAPWVNSAFGAVTTERSVTPSVATHGHISTLRDEGGQMSRHELGRPPMPTTITRRLVSLNDAADALAVSTRTVRRYISDGQLEAVRLGRRTLRIKVDSIERFIDARPVGNWR